MRFLLQSESVLIQKLYTHFKRTPGTHKLGVLYVVDSVTRKWAEQAKLAGQPIGSSASDGTFAAGVNRVKELLPVLMTDIIQSAPEDQKVRSTCLPAWICKAIAVSERVLGFSPRALFPPSLSICKSRSTDPCYHALS